MNAWRCNDCHRLTTDPSHDGPLLVCPLCGGLVFNVTHTEIGRQFIEQNQRPVPETVKRTYLHKRINFLPPERN